MTRQKDYYTTRGVSCSKCNQRGRKGPENENKKIITPPEVCRVCVCVCVCTRQTRSILLKAISPITGTLSSWVLFQKAPRPKAGAIIGEINPVKKRKLIKKKA